MDIRKELEDLKSKIDLVVEEFKKKEKEKEPKEFELYLKIWETKNHLIIGFNSENAFHRLGVITENGACSFLSKSHEHQNWELWKQNGFKVAEQEPVEWKGLKWQLEENKSLGVSKPFPTHFDFIYNFEQKTAYESVRTDDDFLKKDSNNRIHLY